MNADGSNQRNVTKHPGRDIVLGWTTDGASLLLRSARDRTMFDIYVIRVDGTQETRLATTVNER